MTCQFDVADTSVEEGPVDSGSGNINLGIKQKPWLLMCFGLLQVQLL